MKVCTKCKENKSLSEFSNNKNTNDGKQLRCKSCMAEEQNKHYLKNKEKYFEREKQYIKDKQNKINKIKQECGCKKCGEKRFYILNFHHIDPSNKQFSISSHVKKVSWDSMLKEIDKCIVLCSNCHDEFHYLERTTKLKIDDYLNGTLVNWLSSSTVTAE